MSVLHIFKRLLIYFESLTAYELIKRTTREKRLLIIFQYHHGKMYAPLYQHYVTRP